MFSGLFSAQLMSTAYDYGKKSLKSKAEESQCTFCPCLWPTCWSQDSQAALNLLCIFIAGSGQEALHKDDIHCLALSKLH